MSVAEAAALDARADTLLVQAHAILERASIPERAAGRLDSRARLIRCAEAQPVLDEIAALRFRARCLRSQTAGTLLAAQTNMLPSPPPPKKVEPLKPASHATREQALDAIAAGFPGLPAGMLAHAKASGQSVGEFAAAARREADISSLAGGIASFIPGAQARAPQPVHAADASQAAPAGSEDELVESIVAFLPAERRRHG